MSHKARVLSVATAVGPNLRKDKGEMNAGVAASVEPAKEVISEVSKRVHSKRSVRRHRHPEVMGARRQDDTMALNVQGVVFIVETACRQTSGVAITWLMTGAPMACVDRHVANIGYKLAGTICWLRSQLG